MTQESVLARYRILHELGRGAMGAVYAARDRETGAFVALKRFDPALLSKSDASLAGRLLKQARSARRLNHGNIVKIHEAGEVGGTVYVAMEMLEGQNLRNVLDAGPIPLVRAIRIAHDIACGLEYAHLQGVVHGGLKPSNIMVLPSGVVKITDFGIGTAGQSPEQLRGDRVDHRCDLFSLGALLYEMLTQRPPFEGSSPKAILENILRAKPPLPSELNPHVPRALDALVLSLLAAHPDGRLPGAPIVLRDLQRLEEGLGLGSDAPQPTPRTPEPTPRTPERAPRMSEPAPRISEPDRPHDREAFDYEKAMRVMDRERSARSSESRRSMTAAVALVLAALGIGVAGFIYYPSGLSETGVAASRIPEAPAAAPEVPRSAPPELLANPTEAPVDAPDAPPPSLAVSDRQPAKESSSEILAKAETFVAKSDQPAAVGTTLAQEPPQAAPATTKVREPQRGGTARLIVAVSPRGEIYIDGKHHGTTPPITALDLEPGMHRIEVRSGSRKPYLTYMAVKAGDVRRIRHDFSAKPSRPPA